MTEESAREYWGTIRRQGNRWRLRYTDNAGNRRSGGTFTTHEDAWKARNRLNALFQEGKLTPEAIEGQKGKPGSNGGSEVGRETVLDFMNRMRPKRQKMLAKSTFTNECSIVNRYIIPDLGHRVLRELNENDLADWWASLGTRTGAVHRRNVFCTFSAHMRLAVEDGTLDVAPPKPKDWWHMVSEDRPRRTTEEAQALISALPADLRVMMRLSADVHLRPGEARGLNRNDYNVRTGMLHVRRKDNYTGGRRQDEPPKLDSEGKIGVSPDVRPLLEAHLAALPSGKPDSPMFPGVRVDRVTQSWVWKHWKVAREAVGDLSWHVHDLRGVGLTWLDENGFSPKDMMRRSRHSSVASLEPYLLGDERRDAEVTAQIRWPKGDGAEKTNC